MYLPANSRNRGAMDSTTIVSVAGIVGTLAGTIAAPYVSARQAARHARDTELRAARMQLYVDTSASIQNEQKRPVRSRS
jgi:hypothetical protein